MTLVIGIILFLNFFAHISKQQDNEPSFFFEKQF